jgi:endogenous inhibitor of DNA gyrase (YacG/DUF329 family)
VTLRVACPRCKRETEADEEKPLPKHFPFCSPRCQQAELGKWFDEEYRIAGKRVEPDRDAPRDD